MARSKGSVKKPSGKPFSPGNKPRNAFQPGVSGNPAGRPKSTTEFHKKCREHSDEMLERLLRQSRQETDLSLSQRATISIIEYGHGKPRQSIDMVVQEFADWTEAELRHYIDSGEMPEGKDAGG